MTEVRLEYIVNKDTDMLAPDWLLDHLEDRATRFAYYLIDGAVKLKGVRVGNEVAEIGDKIVFNGTRLSVERR